MLTEDFCFDTGRSIRNQHLVFQKTQNMIGDQIVFSHAAAQEGMPLEHFRKDILTVMEAAVAPKLLSVFCVAHRLRLRAEGLLRSGLTYPRELFDSRGTGHDPSRSNGKNTSKRPYVNCSTDWTDGPELITNFRSTCNPKINICHVQGMSGDLPYVLVPPKIEVVRLSDFSNRAKLGSVNLNSSCTRRMLSGLMSACHLCSLKSIGYSLESHSPVIFSHNSSPSFRKLMDVG